jgi:hypothetical protein
MHREPACVYKIYNLSAFPNLKTFRPDSVHIFSVANKNGFMAKSGFEIPPNLVPIL